MKKNLVLLIYLTLQTCCMDIDEELKQSCEALALLKDKFPTKGQLSHLSHINRALCISEEQVIESVLKRCRALNEQQISHFPPEYRHFKTKENSLLKENIKSKILVAKKCINQADL